MSNEEFVQYIAREFGSVANAKNEIRYYYKTMNGKKYVVDEAQSYDSTITAYEHEVELNEARRNIKVLDRALISKLEAQMQDLFN